MSPRISLLLPCCLFAAFAVGDDWPQWRGPQRDGVWRETGVLNKFPAERLEAKWRVPIGPGYSGPTVAGPYVYITDRVQKPEEGERVHCFRAATGEPVWSHTYPRRYVKVGYVAGPRAAVTIDEGRAFSLGTMGDLFCFDATNGNVLWKKDLLAEYSIDMPIWGIASAPLVIDEQLIVQVGGHEACVVSFDKKTGAERWKSLSDRASYAAPILIEQAGKRVLVCWTGDNVVGLNPADGHLYWKHPFKPTRMVISIATPVLDGDHLFVTSFYDGSLLLRLDQKSLTAEKVWRRIGKDEQTTDSLHSIMSTPQIRGDHIYGVDSYGELRCLDTKTGDRIWEDRTATPRNRWSNIHMVRHAATDNVWMFNEAGELVISRLSPKGFEELSRAKLLDTTTDQLPRRNGVCWSHPAYAQKHVFARNDKELICASLAAP